MVEWMETVRFGLMLTSPTNEVQVGIQYSSDTTEVFTPMTGGLTTSKIGSIRASWEQIANSGNVASRVGYQVSKDGVKWTDLSGVTEGTFVDPGLTPRTTAGITYGTTFTSVSASLEDFRWIRFGIESFHVTPRSHSGRLVTACRMRVRKSAAARHPNLLWELR